MGGTAHTAPEMEADKSVMALSSAEHVAQQICSSAPYAGPNTLTFIATVRNACALIQPPPCCKPWILLFCMPSHTTHAQSTPVSFVGSPQMANLGVCATPALRLVGTYRHMHQCNLSMHARTFAPPVLLHLQVHGRVCAVA